MKRAKYLFLALLFAIVLFIFWPKPPIFEGPWGWDTNSDTTGGQPTPTPVPPTPTPEPDWGSIWD